MDIPILDHQPIVGERRPSGRRFLMVGRARYLGPMPINPERSQKVGPRRAPPLFGESRVR